MRFGSVCSGIEAASVAWNPLGWEAAWLAEIEPFPSAVLAHHYPDVPNYGDMSKLPERIRSGEVEAPDLFCGGTPCQAFSVAGLRKSLADERGNLSLIFCDIADAIDESRSVRGLGAAIIFWENVPGVLSTADNAFGCFLAQLCGGDEPLDAPDGWPDAGCVTGPKRTAAWRVLDAQYFGLAQRRRRVFVVASAREGFDPAAVLFEFDGVRRDSAPSREAGKVAPTIPARSTGGGGLGTDFDCDGGVITMAHGQAGAEIGFDRGPTPTCNHEAPIATYGIRTANTSSNGWGIQEEATHTLDQAMGIAVAHSLRGEGFDASEDGTGRGTPLVPVAHCEVMPTMTAGGPSDTSHGQTSGQMRDRYIVPVAFAWQAGGTQTTLGYDERAGTAQTLGANQTPAVVQPYTLAIRGRGDSHNLEYRQDGTANALLTPNGGRGGIGVGAVAFQPGNLARGAGSPPSDEVFPTLKSDHGRGLSDQQPHVLTAMQVRRLTPVECERLQGFPDGYTNIPWRGKPESPDGPRYKALGNSWAVPVVRWIGKRIIAALNDSVKGRK